MTPSRAAAITVLALLVIGVWFGPVAAYRGFTRNEAARLEAAERTLARDRAALAGNPDSSSLPPEAEVLFPERSDAEAIAVLQETLKRAAATAGVEIEDIAVLPPESLSGARRMTVRLKARADIGGINRLLYAIEASRPVLYPDHLAITTPTAIRAAGAPPLEFEVDVSGFKIGGQA